MASQERKLIRRKSRTYRDLAYLEQLQAYTAWVNSQLKKRPGSRFIQDLPRDMKDGVALIQLIEVVAGEKLKVNQNPTTAASMRENVELVLNFMAVNKIRMHHTSAKEILEGNLKATMRLILALAAHFKPGSVKQSVQYPVGAVSSTGKKIARTPSAAAAASEAAAAIAEASRAAASVGRHISSRYRKHNVGLGTPPRENYKSPMRTLDGTPMLPSAESPLLSSPGTGSYSSKEGRSGRSTPGSGATTPKGHWPHDGSEHSGSDVDSGLMCSHRNKYSKDNRMSVLTADFLNELSGEQEVMKDDLGDAKRMLLSLEKMLMEGRVEDDEIPDEYSYLEGTDLKDQLTIMSSRLSQLSAEYDILKTERNNFKEDCIGLQGMKSGLTSRLTQQEEVIMQLKSELLKSSFKQQNRDGEILELQRKIDERDAEISAFRSELLRQERTIDRQRAELEDTLRDMEHMRYAEAGRHYHDDDTQVYELRQRIVDLQERLRTVANHEADISSRISSQDEKMKSLEDKVLNPPEQPGYSPSKTEEMELVRETIRSLQDCFRSQDPQHHTLDALEQTFASLIDRQTSKNTGPAEEGQMNGVEYHDMFGYVRPLHRNNDGFHSRFLEKDSTGASTKVLYFTEKTVTPFLTTIPKRLGNITLRDFKIIFDHPGPYRYHFKALDPEFGTVKEEVIDNEDVVPGWEGKIVAWVEEDRGLIALDHHDNTNYDVNMNES